MCLLLDITTTTTCPTMPAHHVLCICWWCPHTPVIANVILPGLKLDRHIRQSLHNAHFAPNLSVIPECVNDEHKVYEAQDVMTMCDYDLDTFSFSLSSLTLTTPVSLSWLYYYSCNCSFVLLSSLPLYFYHSLTCTAWPMTHSDDSGCTTSLFSYFLVPFIWLISDTLAYTYLL